MSFGGRLGFEIKGQSVCVGENFSVTIFEVQSLSAAVKRELWGGSMDTCIPVISFKSTYTIKSIYFVPFFLTAVSSSPFLNAEKLTELEFKGWRQRGSLLGGFKQKNVQVVLS